jgi:hypothetical protein
MSFSPQLREDMSIALWFAAIPAFVVMAYQHSKFCEE